MTDRLNQYYYFVAESLQVNTINYILEVVRRTPDAKRKEVLERLKTGLVLNTLDSDQRTLWRYFDRYKVSVELADQDEEKEIWTSPKSPSKDSRPSEFVWKGYVDLVKLFAVTKVSTKGDNHRRLQGICFEVHDKWEQTYYHNTNANYRKLLALMKSLNIKHSATLHCRSEKKMKFRKDRVYNDDFTWEANKNAPLPEKSNHIVHKAIVNPNRAKKVTLRQKVEFETQMLSRVKNVVSTADSVCAKVGDQVEDMTSEVKKTCNVVKDQIKEAVTSIKNTSSKISNNSDNLGEILNKIKDFFPNDEHSGWFRFTVYCVKLTSAFKLLSVEENRTPTNVAAIIALAIPTESGVLGLSKVVDLLTRAAQGVSGCFSSTFTTENGVNFFGDLANSIVGLFKYCMGKGDFSSFQISANKISLVARLCKSLTTIFDIFMKVLKFVVDLIQTFLLKQFGIRPKFLRNTEIETLIDDYMEWVRSNKDCAVDSETALIVANLRTRILNMMGAINKYPKYNSLRLMPYLRLMESKVQTAYDTIPPHVLGNAIRRRKPFWLYIFGEPRIGKSAYFQPWIINILAKASGVLSKYEPVENYTYTRNMNDEYWDQYHGQLVTQYNDVFQLNTNEEAITNQISEFTNIVDDVPYPLKIATLEKKGQIYFTSQIVVSNAQEDIMGKSFLANRCWSGGSHIYQRRNIVVKLKLNHKYRKPGGGIDYQVMDENKRESAYGGVPEDMYQVEFYNPSSGAVEQSLSFRNACEYIRMQYKAYMATQTVFKDALYAKMEAEWNTQVDDTFHEQNCQCDAWASDIIMEGVENEVSMARVFAEHLNEDIRKNGCYKTYGDFMEAYSKAKGWNVQRRTTDEYFPMPRYISELNREMREYRERLEKAASLITKLKYVSVISLILATVSWTGIGAAVVNKIYTHTRPFEVESGEMHHKQVEQRLRRRVRGGDFDTQMYDQINEEIEKVLERNFAWFTSEVITNEGVERGPLQGSILCVGGDVFVMPRHFKDVYDDMNMYAESTGVICEYTLTWRTGESKVISRDRIDFWDPPYEHCGDVVFMRLHKACCSRDIKKFFIRDCDIVNPVGCYLYGRRGVKDDHFVSMFVGHAHCDGLEVTSGDSYMPGTKKNLPVHIYKHITAIKYDCLTLRGDCGMVLMGVSNKNTCRRIYGIHVAGCRAKQQGVSNIVYQEDIDEARKYFDIKYPTAPVYQTELSYIELGEEPKSPMKEYAQEMAQYCGRGKDIVNFCGKQIKVYHRLPSTSKISKSIVFDDMETAFGPHNFEPAKLRPFFNEYGVKVKPLELALKKLTNYSPAPSKTEMDVIKEHLINTFRSYREYEYDWKILNPIEASNKYKNMNAIDMSTAPGFPWNKIVTGKSELFDYEEHPEQGRIYKPKEMLLQVATERIEKAQQNIIAETVFLITLKDETRPLERVKLGKTRLFQVGPVDLTLVMRMYFGEFVSLCHSNGIENEMAIGLNALGEDWKYLYQRLVKLNNKVLAGDYSNQDATECLEIALLLADVVNELYDDGRENAMIRRVLIATCVFNYQLFEDVVIERKQGNTSGNLLTTIFNNFFQMFVSRLLYYRMINQDLSRYSEEVESTFTGDDSVQTPAQSIEHIFHMENMAKVLKSIGMEYTSFDKNENKVLLYNIRDINYLKRNFVVDGNRVYSPLDIKVVMEIARWSMGDPTEIPDQMMRFNSTLLELTNYNRQTFDNVRVKFAMMLLHLRTKYNIHVDTRKLLTWENGMKMRFEDDIGHFFVRDLDSEGQQLRELLLNKGSHSDVGKHLKERVEFIVQPPLLTSTGQRITKFKTEIGTNTKETQVREEDFHDCDEDNSVFTLNDPTEIFEMDCGYSEYDDYDGWEAQMDTPNNSDHDGNRDFYMEMSEDEKDDEEQKGFLSKKERQIIVRRVMKGVDKMSKYIIPNITGLMEDLRRLTFDHQFTSALLIEVQNLLQSLVNIYRKHDRYEGFETQMEGEGVVTNTINKGPSDPDAIVGIIETAKFTDKNEHVIEDIDYRKNHLPNPWVVIDLPTFVSRPYQIIDFAFTPGVAYKTRIAQFDPLDLVYQMIKGKIDQAAFWAPDLEVTFRMSAGVSTYGSLIAGWDITPIADVEIGITKRIENIVLNPNWIVMLAGSQQTYTMQVPFTWYEDRIPVFQDEGDYKRKYKPLVTVCVLNPLLTAAPGTVPNVSVQVWARIVEPRFAGVVPPGYDAKNRFETQMWGDKMEQVHKKSVNLVKKAHGVTSKVVGYGNIVKNSAVTANADLESKRVSEDGTIKPSNVVGAVGNFISKLTPIPFIGDFAGPISGIAGDIAKALSWMGWSVPRNILADRPVFSRGYDFSQVEGLVAGQNIGYFPEGTIPKDFSLVGGNVDEMSYKTLAQIPWLYDSLSVPATTAMGTEILAMSLRYDSFKSVVTTSLGNAYYSGVLGMLANTYTYMRGGIRIAIQVVCSPFHSFRLRFSYVPNAGIKPDFSDTQYIAQDTVEITSSTDFCYVVPMLAENDWARTTDELGYFQIFMASNANVLPGTTGNFYINVWVSAASDFQVAEPRGHTVARYNYARSVTITGNPISETSIDDIDFETQMTDTNDLISADPELYPAQTCQRLIQANYMPLGTHGTGHLTDGIVGPHEMVSVKQDCNRTKLCKEWKLSKASGVVLLAFASVPRMYNNTVNSLCNVPFYIWEYAFRFRRGGIRYQVRTANKRALHDCYFGYAAGYKASLTAIRVDNYNKLPPEYQGNHAGSIEVSDAGTRIDVNVPYTGITKCYGSITQLFTNIPIHPYIIFTYDATPGAPYEDSVMVHCGASDDYILGCYRGIPLYNLGNLYPGQVLATVNMGRFSPFSQDEMNRSAKLGYKRTMFDREMQLPEPSNEQLQKDIEEEKKLTADSNLTVSYPPQINKNRNLLNLLNKRV